MTPLIAYLRATGPLSRRYSATLAGGATVAVCGKLSVAHSSLLAEFKPSLIAELVPMSTVHPPPPTSISSPGPHATIDTVSRALECEVTAARSRSSTRSTVSLSVSLRLRCAIPLARYPSNSIISTRAFGGYVRRHFGAAVAAAVVRFWRLLALLLVTLGTLICMS